MREIFIVSWHTFPSYEGTTARIKGITYSLKKNHINFCILTPLFYQETYIKMDNKFNVKYFDIKWLGKIYQKIYYAKYVAIILFWVWAFLILLKEIKSIKTIVQYEHIYSGPPVILLKKIRHTNIIGDEINIQPQEEHNFSAIALAFEKWVISQTDIIFTSFPDSFRKLQSRFKNKQVFYLPNGIHAPILLNEDNKNSLKDVKKIIFVGSLNSLDNLMAIECIIKIAEILSKERRDFQIIIVGGPIQNISYLSSIDIVKDSLIKFLGFIPDQKLEHLYKESFIGLLPFYHQFTHSSQRIKALEYFSRNLLVISSPKALEGFSGIKNKVHALIANSPLEMANLINECISYPQKYVKISEQGMIKIAHKYSWESITREYVRLLLSFH